MAQSSHRKLVLLICINVVLLTALVLCRVELPQAQAQVRQYDYMLVPGNSDTDQQIVWVIDLRTFQLTTCYYDRNSEQIVVGEYLDLAY
ncbi:MAG: hypothetical protein JW936_01195 [Sedimentisphaerales bacterium]|nr:hypothetical protein [Sedimentisphaerales bacterium]